MFVDKNRVLLAIDYVPQFGDAANAICARFDPLTTAVHILHVVEPNCETENSQTVTRVRQGQLLVGQALSKVQEKGFKVSAEVSKGFAIARIVQCAEFWNPDLIVFGGDSKKGVGSQLGHVAKAMLSITSHSVEIVKTPGATPRVLLVVNSPESAQAVPRAFLRQFRPGHAEVCVFYLVGSSKPDCAREIWKIREQNLCTGRRLVTEVQGIVRNAHFEANGVIGEGGTPSMILRYAKEWGAKLIIVAHGNNSEPGFELSSISEFIGLAACSVQVVRPALPTIIFSQAGYIMPA